MDRISKTELTDKNILEVNYSHLKEAGMTELLKKVKQMILQDKKPVLIISYFNHKNYVTPAFIIQAREITLEVLPYIEKMAFVGLSFTQKILLKGFNIALQRNFRSFETREEALQFMLDKNTTDNDLPDYFRK
jgi:hypothetical protein